MRIYGHVCQKSYKHQIFIENPYLFHLAINYHRIDFLHMYNSYLTYMIRFIPSLLQHVLLQLQLEVIDLGLSRILLRRILLSWQIVCNYNNDNMLEQQVYHASYFMPTIILIQIASKFPQEFIAFISGLKLIKNHDSLLKHYDKQKLHVRNRFELVGVNDPSIEYLLSWRKVLKGNLGGYNFSQEFSEALLYQRFMEPEHVTSLMVPLMHGGSLMMLTTFVEVSHALQSMAIFDSPVGAMILKYYWNYRGKRNHIRAFIMYLVNLILFMICMKIGREPDYLSSFSVFIIELIVLALFVYYLYEEIQQFRNKLNILRPKLSSTILFDGKEGCEKEKKYVYIARFMGLLLSHFCLDIWNVFDVVAASTGISGLTLRIVSKDRENNLSRMLLSITAITLWFKALYFMRPFPSSGPLGKSLSLNLPNLVSFYNSSCSFYSYDDYSNSLCSALFFSRFILWISRICSSVLASQ